MYELKKIGKVFTSKLVGTGPSSYQKRIYRAAVSQRLRNIALGNFNTMVIIIILYSNIIIFYYNLMGPPSTVIYVVSS